MNTSNKKIIGSVLGIAFIGLLTLLFITKGGNKEALPSPQKIQVVASFYSLYFFTSQIGGNKVDVTNITPAGAEPHDYEPTAEDIAKIETSKLLILNGNVESWGEKIKQNIDPKQTTIVTAGEGLTTQTVVEDGQSMVDPHVWLDPVLAKQMADKIEAGLAQIDPANAAYYLSNTLALKTKFDALDAEYRQGLSSCKKKDIITSHAAFGYLATDYHLNQVPISGLSPDAEPSPKQLADVAKFAKDNHVQYIFFESLVSPKLSQTVATEIGAKTLVLNPIEGLTSDDIASGKNYFTEMQSNLINLQIALQCTP